MKLILYAFLCVGVWAGRPIFSEAQVTANFTANNTSGCSPIVIQFTDQSTGNPTSWNWNLGNGVTSTLQNPSTTYVTAGSYTVTLTASNGTSSNTKVVTNYITVLPSPFVNFVVSDSNAACAPETVQFTNLSIPESAGATTYLWDFGDGTTSNTTNPSHTYTNGGNSDVTLVVINSNGCIKSLVKTQYVQTVSPPTANFSAIGNSTCTVPANVTFFNTSSGAVSYFWNFGDGATSTLASPSHTYNTSGSYTVTLVATNSIGCTDTLTLTSFVSLGNLNASFTPTATTACTGNNVSFSNTSTPGPGNSTWSFGDGTTSTVASPVHAYTTPGTYTVKLVVNFNNCSDSATGTVTVTAGPVVAFTGSPTYNCKAPLTVQFSNTTTGATSYLWQFGNSSTSAATSPSNTYNATGSYTVTLIATSANGCKDTLTKPNYIVIEPPVASLNINPSQGCAPFNVSYTTSVSAPATATSGFINFGDGSTTTTATSGTHTYTNAGTYVATYTYTTPGGCTDSAQTTVLVGTPPVAGFTAAPNPVCPQMPVTFTNTSTGYETSFWTFDDGTTSTATNPVHSYHNPGTYTVDLFVTNNGCTEEYTQQIIVSPPQANFTVTYNCANRLQVQFQDISTGANTWLWNFGDGNTSTQESPQHTFAAYGGYAVTLTVTNAATGCTNTTLYNLNLFPNPLTQFTSNVTTLCRNQAVNLTASASTNITSNYNWNFGDGFTTSTAANSDSHTYTAAGTYTVSVNVTDRDGCVDSLVHTDSVHVGGATPAFTGSPLTGCAPLNVNFQDQSTDAAGINITSRLWRFGNGLTNTGNNTNVSSTYISGGTYSVTLVTTDAIGCVDSLVNPNYITVSQPVAIFSTADTAICPGLGVPFVNGSTSLGTFTYLWIFGDGSTSTITNPSHAYTAPGSYTVSLVAISANGCRDTLTRTAYIHVTPLNVGFTLSDTFATCPPLSVSTTNTSTGNNNYLWALGNGSTSTLVNPTTLYSYPGTYTIKLVAHSDGGCADSVSKNVVVLGPTGTLTYTSAIGCSPVTIQLSSVSQNTTSYTWDMNNGYTQVTTSPTFTYTYTQAGVYVPTLVLSNGNCQIPIVGADTIKVDKVNADFSFLPAVICAGGVINFIDTTYSSLTNINSRHWNFGDGATSTTHNPSHTYATTGTFQVTLIIGDATGCLDTITKTVTVAPPPVVSAGPPQSICAGQTTPVQLQATGASTYVWSPAAGLSCTTCPNPQATVTATTTYTVIGTNAGGCSDTATVTITVNPLPVVSAGSNQAICSGTTAQLQASGAVSYVWSPAAGLSCTTCSNPVATVSGTSTYTVTGTNANGCANTAQVTVTVNPPPTVSAGPNQSICNGASTPLQATGAVSYTWVPGTGLSCTACANPVANPATTTTYVITGINSNGCSDTAHITITVNPKPIVNASGAQAICQGQTDSAQLEASGANTYTWSPATGLSCTACVGPTALPAATTTYIVTGTLTNGCSDTAAVIVTINPLPTVSAGNNQTICAGSTAALQATGASTYVWSPATGLSCTACANTNASPAITTTYTVTGTNTNGCTDTSSVTVTVSPTLSVSAGANQTICSGTTAQLQATGASTYTWLPTTGLSCATCANTNATPTTTTTYVVTGAGGSGCTDTAHVTVTVNPLPTITAANETVCSGVAAQLVATGASTYVWSPATGLSCTTCDSPVANPPTTTTYTITGTNANGCVDSGHVTVTIDTLPVVNAGNNQSICDGTSAQLQATGAVNYVWSPATGLSCTACANPLANPAATTTYTVTGTNVGGCSDTSQVTVTIKPLPVVSASANQSICAGGSVPLTVNGASTYSWSPVAGLSCTACDSTIATPATTTTYVVTGTGTNGCTDTAHVTVTVNALPVITGANEVVCSGVSVQLLANGAVTYSWSPVAGLSCTNCANPTANPDTTTIYTITGMNANNCTDSGHVTVTVDTLPVVHAGNDQTICLHQPAQLHATGAVTYTWSPVTGLSCAACASPTANPTSTTIYRVTGTNANGCSDTSHITVTVLPLPIINAGPPQSICKDASAQLGATGSVSYIWSPATGLSCTACDSPVASPASLTTYTVTGTGSNGCTDTASVAISIYPQPIISGGPAQTECAGTPIQLQATGGVTYTWSPDTGLSCTHCPDPYTSTPGNITYTVIGTDINGCTDSATVSVMVILNRPVTITPDDTICAGQSVQLSATGGSIYQWFPPTGLNNSNIADPYATPEITTTYTAIVTENQCFTDTGYMTIVVNPLPTVKIGGAQGVIAGEGVTLTPAITGDIAMYQWVPATGLSCDTCADPVAEPTATTSYTLTVTNVAGCKASDSITITVGCDKSQIFIPNTFTPNGDGVNDRFFISGKGISIIKKFSVYDRWGELIFEAEDIPVNDQMRGWDGTFKGRQLSPDVYVYMVDAVCETGQPLEFKGDVSLVR